jgi:hypothetical protein
MWGSKFVIEVEVFVYMYLQMLFSYYFSKEPLVPIPTIF